MSDIATGVEVNYAGMQNKPQQKLAHSQTRSMLTTYVPTKQQPICSNLVFYAQSTSAVISERERQTDRQTDRDRDTETQRETERDTDTDRQTDRGRDREMVGRGK